MKTAIVYYSQHHGNTKKLIEAIAKHGDVLLIDATNIEKTELSEFDCIGFASGAYFSSFSKHVLEYAKAYLPEQKAVFFINTCGVKTGVYFDAIRKIAKAKKCQELGTYQCLGYDTFGPFKLVGGIAKGHPDVDEINGAVAFYQNVKEQFVKTNQNKD